MILVTGATGKVGRNVVEQLLGEGAEVRALVRTPETAGLPDGVEVVRGDLSDPASVEAALKGVDGVFLVWPFMTAEGAAELVGLIGRQARRVVYLSMAGLDENLPDQGTDIGNFHAELQRLIRGTGLEWTFLQPGGFAGNTLGWAGQVKEDGVVRQPFGAATRALIHERDVAAVGVRALIEDGHVGAEYHLTGPETLSQVEQATAIGEAIGRPVRFEEQSREEARAEMAEFFGSVEAAEKVLGAWESMIGRPEETTGVVREITGVEARTFLEWAHDHAADFG